ncbi:MAG: DUF2752 domain-containing protein [Myxococcus sp.]|nr:DUF2752 domain-containing protein [Myxococcus sp.]
MQLLIKLGAVVDRTVSWRIVVQPLLSPAFRALAAVVLAASFLLAPGKTGPDLCPLHRLTGLPCPGCGVTRGLMHFSHGEWPEALGANPWVLVLWPALAALALAVVVPTSQLARFEAFIARHEPWPSRVVRVLFVAFFAFGLLRLGYFAATGAWFP